MAKFDPADADGDDQRQSKRAALAPAASPGSRPSLISNLPDDILVSILAYLQDTRAAARTSVLSRSWRNIWLGLSNLQLLLRPDSSGPARAALAAHAAGPNPKVAVLDVCAPLGTDPESAVSLLRAAAPLVSEELHFHNRCQISRQALYDELQPEPQVRMEHRGTVELPCLENTATITLCFGFLGLRLPPSGVFANLRALRLDFVQFHAADCTMDDTMFPFLKDLCVAAAGGLSNLKLRLEPLLWLSLEHLVGLQRLHVEAPALKALAVKECFCLSKSTVFSVDIKTAGLDRLVWVDSCIPPMFRFNEMPFLQQLYPSAIHLSGPLLEDGNSNCARILNQFTSIYRINLYLEILPDLQKFEPLVKGIASLPKIAALSLDFATEGHVYGATVLHLLTMCTGIRTLMLMLHGSLKEQNSCPLQCACDPKPDWRSQNIPMKFLTEVQISYLEERSMKLIS